MSQKSKARVKPRVIQQEQAVQAYYDKLHAYMTWFLRMPLWTAIIACSASLFVNSYGFSAVIVWGSGSGLGLLLLSGALAWTLRSARRTLGDRTIAHMQAQVNMGPRSLVCLVVEYTLITAVALYASWQLAGVLIILALIITEALCIFATHTPSTERT